MTRKQTAAALVIGAAIVTAACEKRLECVTSPTEVTQASQALTAGNWMCASTAAPSSFSPGTCGNAEWKISSLTGSSASGAFKATCGGGLTLEGTAEGKFYGPGAELKASGAASGAGANCAFSLTGTAVPEGLDAVRITYSGATCLGPVSGCEVLKKQ